MTADDFDVVQEALNAAKQAWFSGLRAALKDHNFELAADEFNERIAPAHEALDRIQAENERLRDDMDRVLSLMAALVDGNLTGPLEQWAAAWVSASAALGEQP